MVNKPRWKEAQELAKLYQERGIAYCYNDRNHNVYLSLLEAPYCVPNVEGCQLTGYLVLYGGVVESRNIEYCIDKFISQYSKAYADNELMLGYLEPVKEARKMARAKATKIREWYSKAYPTDDIVSHIREDVTFWGLFDALDNYQDVYAFIFKDGWEDSIVRERCFEHLAEIMEIPYKEIYDQWMAGA